MSVVIDASDVERALDLFRQLPEKFERSMRLTMKKAVRNVREKARREHAFVTRAGVLERAIDSDVQERPLVGYVFVTNDAPYGKYVHEGTRPHEIRPRRKKALRWATGGGFVFAKSVMHPGTKADPFLQNALDRERDDVVALFKTAVNDLAKEVAM